MRQRRSIEHLAYPLTGCPRDVPELPSTANGRHMQPPANMKLGRALNPRSPHENTLVMRSSRPTRHDGPDAGYTRNDLAWQASAEYQQCR
jgi:hypothetical protein